MAPGVSFVACRAISETTRSALAGFSGSISSSPTIAGNGPCKNPCRVRCGQSGRPCRTGPPPPRRYGQRDRRLRENGALQRRGGRRDRRRCAATGNPRRVRREQSAAAKREQEIAIEDRVIIGRRRHGFRLLFRARFSTIVAGIDAFERGRMQWRMTTERIKPFAQRWPRASAACRQGCPIIGGYAVPADMHRLPDACVRTGDIVSEMLAGTALYRKALLSRPRHTFQPRFRREFHECGGDCRPAAFPAAPLRGSASGAAQRMAVSLKFHDRTDLALGWRAGCSARAAKCWTNVM